MATSWEFVRSVLIRLSEEDWEFVFENDRDHHELEEIEEYNTVEERLDKVKEYFDLNGMRDPILSTRLILTPPKSSDDIIILYGKTIELHSLDHIKTLFDVLWDEVWKIRCKQ